MRLFHSALIVLALSHLSASAAVFQYTVPVQTEKGVTSAFLWMPPEAKQVRGVVMAGTTVMEKEFAKDPTIRNACTIEQLAIIFLKCGLGMRQEAPIGECQRWLRFNTRPGTPVTMAIYPYSRGAALPTITRNDETIVISVGGTTQRITLSNAAGAAVDNAILLGRDLTKP